MSQTHHFVRSDATIVEVSTTTREDGDFHIGQTSDDLRARRAEVMAGRWAVVHQVHGAVVVDADPDLAPEADALMTAEVGQPIAVQGADCAPIAFITDTGPIAVAHAGWRGLAAGVVERTIERLRTNGAETRMAVVGPVICVECYEFGEDDLAAVAAVLGDDVRGQTSSATPALDLRAAITTAFAAHDVDDVRFVARCTACQYAGFSHRARKEPQRHALVARITSAAS